MPIQTGPHWRIPATGRGHTPGGRVLELSLVARVNKHDRPKKSNLLQKLHINMRPSKAFLTIPETILSHTATTTSCCSLQLAISQAQPPGVTLYSLPLGYPTRPSTNQPIHRTSPDPMDHHSNVTLQDPAKKQFHHGQKPGFVSSSRLQQKETAQSSFCVPDRNDLQIPRLFRLFLSGCD